MATRRTSTWVPSRGEVILIDYNPRAGAEMPDLHPMLVASAREFAERTKMVFGFALTHAGFHASNPFAIEVRRPDGEVSYVLAHQAKTFDWQARSARPHSWGMGHDKVLADVLRRFDSIHAICSR